MILLNFLPDFVFHLILLVGIAGIILSFALRYVPVVSMYRIPIQLVGIVLMSIGLWYEGGIASQTELRTKLEKLEAELAVAKKESGKITKEIVTKLIVEKQIIKEKGQTIKEYIDREVTVYDETCPLPKSVVTAHNAAALNKTDLLKDLNSDTVVDIKIINEAAAPKIKLAPKK
jgi:hypothetical protein